MSHVLDTQAFLDMVCELLHEGQTHVAVPVAGSSMVPFLHNGDTVYLDLLDTPIKRGDIVLYTRSNGRYILHRVYKVLPEGGFIMVGDAQQELEYLPSRDMIHARVTSALVRGKVNRPGMLRWWLYQHLWMWLLPVRHRLMTIVPRLKFWRKRK
jgi:signal peptidase I